MPKKILLADDSITIQKVVELTFSDGDYEVTAVNNGAKAVQKLAEMRPDIILSDIIMPEKNGYEVCEYVKSHPEYRSIPVVLLTGTFEPFDPDRAEKAGCDAVVTKPFESQSLIHKVEELISAAQTAPQPQIAAPAPPPAPEPASSPWLDETPATAPAPPPPAPVSPFSTATEAVPALSMPYTHDSDIFGAAPASSAGSADMPFETPADQSTESPFGAPPDAEAFSGETRAFTKMSFEDLQQQMATPAPTPEPEPEPVNTTPEPSPWDEPAEAPAFGGETRAFPKMSFDDLQAMAASPSAPAWAQEEEPVAETAAPTPEAAPEPESPFSFGEPAAEETPFAASSEAAEPALEELPAAEPQAAEPEEQPSWAQPEQPSWSAPEPAAEAAPAPAIAPSSEPSLPIAASGLTEEQVDRIARRVVELMSDQVIRNIAWEVIPDMAEMVVKERIRQLESEA